MSYPFDCRPLLPSFHGDLFSTTPSFLFSMFNTSSGAHPLAYPDAANPFYFALASMTPGVYGLDIDHPEIDTTSKGTGIILWCNTTVHEVVYSRVNSSLTAFQPLSLPGTLAAGGNTTLGGLFGQAMSVAPGFWQPALRDSLQKTVLQLVGAEDPAGMLLRQFPGDFSRIAAAFGAPGLSPRENGEEQVRGEMIVAAVRMGPLFMVVVLGFGYALLAGVLAVVALSTGEEVHDGVVRLGVAGIVAAAFEEGGRAGRGVGRIEGLYGEWMGKGSQRVGIRKTGSGLGFEMVGGNRG